MVIESVHHTVFWLNAFPHQYCKYEFGQYVQVHSQHNNRMMPCTTGAIALQPTGNAQGNFFFLSLTTGCVLNQVQATPLPMPDDVISWVKMLEW